MNYFNIIFTSVFPNYNNSLKISIRQDLFISYPQQCLLQVQPTSSFVAIIYDYEAPLYAVLSIIQLPPVLLHRILLSTYPPTLYILLPAE